MGGSARFVAPHLAPHEGVHGLGEGLREAVGQQFGHDGRIVVAPGAELFRQLLQPDAGRQGETADPVAVRCDEVRQRQVLLAARLVAQHGRRFSRPFASVTRMSSPSERAGRCRYPLQRQQPLVADAGQQGLGVGEDLARLGALFGMVENLGVTPLESPRREEETPVDVRFGVGHVEVGEDHAPRVERHDGFVLRRAAPRRARFGDRNEVALPQPAAYSSRRACWSAFTLSA